MNKYLKHIGIFFIFSVISTSTSNSEEGYMYGGAKLFNYNVSNSELQAINTSLVNLGFSSSTTSSENEGTGFDIGVGSNLTNFLAWEIGYVNYGKVEITTTTTGPAETIKTEIDGDGITSALVLKVGKNNINHAFLKVGAHAWDLKGRVNTSLGSSSQPFGHGTDPYFALGFKTKYLFAGYDYYLIDDNDISSYSIGLWADF